MSLSSGTLPIGFYDSMEKIGGEVLLQLQMMILLFKFNFKKMAIRWSLFTDRLLL